MRNGEHGCFQQDDMHRIAQSIIESDLIVFRNADLYPFCTTELKAVLDRFYGLTKLYGSAKGNFVGQARRHSRDAWLRRVLCRRPVRHRHPAHV
ncbi:MAG: hypothetical protein R2881_03360 [Eubacteriales bacterium]